MIVETFLEASVKADYIWMYIEENIVRVLPRLGSVMVDRSEFTPHD